MFVRRKTSRSIAPRRDLGPGAGGRTRTPDLRIRRQLQELNSRLLHSKRFATKLNRHKCAALPTELHQHINPLQWVIRKTSGIEIDICKHLLSHLKHKSISTMPCHRSGRGDLNPVISCNFPNHSCTNGSNYPFFYLLSRINGNLLSIRQDGDGATHGIRTRTFSLWCRI